jgi:hypothetical protein
MHSHPPSKPPFGGSRDGDVGTTSIREEPECLSAVGLTDMEGRKPRRRKAAMPDSRPSRRAARNRRIRAVRSWRPRLHRVVGTSGSLPVRSVCLRSSSRSGPNLLARGSISLDEGEEKSSASRRTAFRRRLSTGYRHLPRLGPGFVRIPAEHRRDHRQCFGRADGGSQRVMAETARADLPRPARRCFAQLTSTRHSETFRCRPSSGRPARP